MPQTIAQNEGETNAAFFRRSFLAFAKEKMIVANIPKNERDNALDNLASQLD